MTTIVTLVVCDTAVKNFIFTADMKFRRNNILAPNIGGTYLSPHLVEDLPRRGGFQIFGEKIRKMGFPEK